MHRGFVSRRSATRGSNGRAFAWPACHGRLFGMAGSTPGIFLPFAVLFPLADGSAFLFVDHPHLSVPAHLNLCFPAIFVGWRSRLNLLLQPDREGRDVPRLLVRSGFWVCLPPASSCPSPVISMRCWLGPILPWALLLSGFADTGRCAWLVAVFRSRSGRTIDPWKPLPVPIRSWVCVAEIEDRLAGGNRRSAIARAF
jgi:hypothetical protein